ncbi:serine protease [Streptomyces antnestii]|uniref:Serine protease n=1 Tax=Streptomyces antnestii TaxID=2494256 RepID=A0A437PJT3_9ACTN|nr:trypsin-like peptidase domain-containing protein [Streptomyces sp. San01]RVU22507.1 serine protease [Streptomyces sp. San01]
MAGRGPRAGDGDATGPEAGPPLVRVLDLAGRLRGTGFVADDRGTVVTSHEAVDGLARLVLRAPAGTTCVAGTADITPLPRSALALIRTDGTEGLGLRPLPVAVRAPAPAGSYVRIAAGGWREARVLGHVDATYAASDRGHTISGAMELAIGTDGRDALRPGGGAAGGPVLDAASGAVLAVLSPALQAGHRAAGLAVPLREAAATDPAGPLAALLARNAATVPVYGDELNLAGALQLTATSVGSDGPAGVLDPEPVERPDVAREFTAFEGSDAAVLALVGAPGSGRTTELAAYAARRGRGAHPAPTLWLRGADLHGDDRSVADAARRALVRAGRIVAASLPGAVPGAEPGAVPGAVPGRTGASGGAEGCGGACGGGIGDVSPERIAAPARAAGRPLVLLLDGPEEMPPVLAHRLAEWTDGTARWLRDTGVRLVVACRGEYWERAGELFPARALYGRAGRLPACVPLGELTADQARLAHVRYGLPEDALAARDARHPLALRLLAEVRAALGGPVPGSADRDAVFAAYLDLMCLRVAVRLAAVNGLRGTAVRRLAARVSGQVHEAARRCLGPGQGELDREAFQEVFPWGALPGRRGGGVTAWAPAVLAEGVLVPAGRGYRFAHEEVADWIQGMHLDLDEALRALVHRERQAGRAAPTVPVPRHRAGPVVQALLLVERQRGLAQLGAYLTELALRSLTPGDGEASWWAGHLVEEALLRVPDATPYLDVLEPLADRGCLDPSFWRRLPVTDADRLALLRRLVVHDPPPGDHARHLDTVAEMLAADPARVQAHLTSWFDDERPLPALPDATVATAAQALLHTHRHRGVDDLTEALADCAHPRGDELLAVLADEEPSALCRAVDRWSHDERPARRAAAVTYALRVAPHVTTDADRRLLRYAALALLARTTDGVAHGAALSLLVRDPATRDTYLARALARFADGDPLLPASAFAGALATHPEAVFRAFHARVREPGGAAGVLRTLADVTAPALTRRAAALVRDLPADRPEAARDVADYVDRCLEHGPAGRAVLFPLVTGLLRTCPAPVRAALAPVLALPGTGASRALRAELVDVLLAHEDDPDVLDAVLRTAARNAPDAGEARTRDLLRRTGLRLVRTPEGAARFDRGLVGSADAVPGFAALVVRCLAQAPGEWAVLVGPSARRVIERLAGVRVPA